MEPDSVNMKTFSTCRWTKLELVRLRRHHDGSDMRGSEEEKIRFFKLSRDSTSTLGSLEMKCLFDYII